MADEIAGLAVKIAMDDSSFTTGIQSLKRELNILDSGFKVTESSSATFGKSLDGLKEKASSLGEKIEVQQKIVQQYQEQLSKSKTVLEENSKTLMELKEKVDMAKAAWQESATVEGENAEATKKLETEYKNLEKEYQSQEQLVTRNSKSVDGYTIQTNKQQATLNSMRNELNATNKEIETQGSKWISTGNQLTTLSKKTKDVGEGLTNVGESMSTKVTLPIVAGLTAATVSASTFEHQMADISKEVASKGEDVNSVMGQMSSSSLKWSEDFGQSTTSINEGLLTLVKDGYTGSEAMNIMETSLDTARGADEDLATVVDKLGSSLEAYGMKTNDAATTTANMTHMADVFAYTANHSKASISSLGEAFSIVGPLASQLKIPMQQTAAAIGELESNGIDASTAATALQAGLVNLTKPTAKMQAALKEMNFSAFDSKGKMKDLTTIIAEMSQKTAGWTDKQREAAYATIFGKESLATWGILMHKGSDYLGTLSTNANSATGEVKKLSDSMKNTPQNNLKELEGSMKALGVAIGEDVVPTLIPLAKDATEAVKSFANLDDGTKKMIITVAGIAAVVGPTLVVIGKVATGISVVEGLIGKASGAIGKKVVANATDTASTAANTAATNINTAAQEANTKARETNATSEGISTVAKDASTAAEAENTAATVANEAAQGKNAVSAVNTAEKMTKLSGEAGTAGKALLGAGTAAGTAGEAIAGAGTAATSAGEATVGMGTAATGASVSLGVVAAAAAGVALAGYGIYKAYKYTTDQTVPQVDLFGDSVVSTATKVKAQNGTVATQMKDTTVSISNSTKQAISSYMDMDKKVSKSMQDIYVNANNFSKQEKSTVISAYTDMANKVTSLTGSNKTATINNFKQMVANTSTLTAQNRSQIVAQYTQMVNQVTGLTAQQKQKVIKDFSDSLVQASGITKSQATGIINQFKQMGDKITSAMNTTDQNQLKSVQDLFSKTKTLTNTEQNAILQKMQQTDAAKKNQITQNENEISDIYNKAASEHRNLNQQEQTEVEDVRERMQKVAVQTMSKSEQEQEIITQRLKDYNGQMTLAQASETIQNAEKAHKGAVDAAEKQYNEQIVTIKKMRDEDHTITADQADKMIKEAKRQRDQSVKEADGQKKEVVDKVKQMNSSAVSELDTGTGKQLDVWQKLERGIGGIINSISSKWNSTMSSIFGNHSINVTTNIKGSSNGYSGGGVGRTTYSAYASGTNSAASGWRIVGENGPELEYSESGGETILDNQKTMKLLSGKIDSSVDTSSLGSNIVTGIAEGMNSKVSELASATSNIANTINTTMSQSAKDIFNGFKNQLTDSVDVINNKAIAVSSTLSSMVQPERNARSDMFSALAKGTETYDTALNKLGAENDKLGVSTGNADTDLRNMLGEMTNLSTISVIAQNQYEKLGKSIGWTDSQTQDALKTYQDAQKSYLELGQKVIQAQKDINDSITSNQQQMGETVESSLNDLFDKLKSSLKDYYDDAEKQEEDYWQNQIKANDDWKQNTLDNLETVYNSEKEKIENKKTLLSRQNSDEDDNDKIAADKKILDMNYSAKAKADAQADLDNILKEQNRRHQEEMLEDQEKTLDDTYNTDKADIEKVAQTNDDYYNGQIDSIKSFYAEKEKEANLDAEAQKLIVSNNQKEIVNLLQSYGQDYEIAGSSLGERLVTGFESQMYSIQEIADATTKNINNIVSEINTASLSVPSTALATSANYSTKNYNTSYNNSYGSLLHADNIVLNNNQDTKNLMEEIQRIADIQRMSKGVR